MKKQHTLALLLMAGLMLGSCSSDDNTATEEPAQPNKEVKTYHATTVASMGEDGTRALSLDGNTLNVGWRTNEYVYVLDADGNSLGYLRPTVIDGTAATLEGTLTTGSISAGDEVTLRFVGSKGSPDKDYTNQGGTIEGIDELYDFAELTTTVESVSGDNITINGGTLVSQQAIVKFTFIDGNGDPVDVGEKRVTITATTIDESVKCYPDNISQTNQGIAYVALPIARSSATTLNFIVKDEEETQTLYTGTKYISIPMENGKYYTATVTLTAN